MKRVKLELSFFALICILGWLDIQVCFWFFLGMTVHELGHLLAIWLLRVPLISVRVTFAGAQIKTGPMKYGTEILCALAGPASGMAAALCCLRLQPEFALVSGCMSLANLLPLYPLDGGRVLAAALSRFRGRARIMRAVTGVVCCVLMLLSCWLTVVKQAGLWPMFVSLLILWRAGEQEKLLLFPQQTDTI